MVLLVLEGCDEGECVFEDEEKEFEEFIVVDGEFDFYCCWIVCKFKFFFGCELFMFCCCMVISL